MLHRIDYIEQMGTGIMRMRNAATEANVAEPEFVLDGFFKVIFRRSESVASDPQAAVSDRKRSQAVIPADRKRAIINFLEEHGQAKATELIDITGLSHGRVRTLLREMVSDDTVAKIGDNRYTYYVLKK